MTLTAEVLSLVNAAALAVNVNRKQLDRQSYEIWREGGDEAVELFAGMIDRSPSYVKDRARCYELRELLKSEFPQYPAWDDKVQDTIFLELAKHIYAKDESIQIDVPEAAEKLQECYDAACNGERVLVERVKAELPHNDRDVDYLSAARRIIPVIVKRLINAPALGVPERVYAEARQHFQAGVNVLREWMEQA